MKEQKDFILRFLDKEAEAWTKLGLDDVESYNKSVRELYGMAIDELADGLGIFERNELRKRKEPRSYQPRHLYKLSAYKNEHYGDLWVAYVSYSNPIDIPGKSSIDDAFFIAKIENNLKIVGTMSVALSESDMKRIAWEKSIYNPSSLNIYNLGQFIATERYSQPEDEGFSLQEYFADR